MSTCDCCCYNKAAHQVSYYGWAPPDNLCTYCYEVRLNGDRCGRSCQDWNEDLNAWVVDAKDPRLLSLLIATVDKIEYSDILGIVVCNEFDTYCKAVRMVERCSKALKEL
jgi:hypothetical protein